jgi:RimJ/RimL family protein N-acetyltransferase
MFEFGTVRFRAIEKEDLKYLHSWCNDYDLNLISGAYPLTSMSFTQVEEWYNNLLKNKDRQLLIIEKIDDHEILGVVGIGWSSIAFREVKDATIGVGIASKNNWNRGFGKTITLGLLEMLFYHRSFERVSADSLEFNKRAHKVLEYCGFKKEGERKRWVKVYGKYYSQYLYGLIYEDYMQIREKLLIDTLKDKYEQYLKMITQLEFFKN